jgi:DNA replication protein DnaC
MKALKLFGMARALEAQLDSKQARELSFEERLGMLLDAEEVEKDNKKYATRLNAAKLRVSASVEDIKFKASRGMDRSLLVTLATCDGLRYNRCISITGATGVGKSYLSCALAHQACKQGFSAFYVRAPLIFDDLSVARADGRYKKVFESLTKPKLLILDDFGLSTLSADARRDMLEIMEQRYDVGSTVITSQFERGLWHKLIGDPTLADAILDRFVHNSYKIELTGETMRGNKTEK